MRIIAGSAGGIVIKAPAAVMRPTSDRVREAIFSMLGDLVPGARVLDLFAGSGAMGLEALSRGAREVVWVEQHGGACATIEENQHKARLEGGRVLRGEAMAALGRLAEDGARFDLVFADPPYAKRAGDMDFGARLLNSMDLQAVLECRGWFVLETMMTKQAPRVIAGWHMERDRAYGSTRVLLLQRSPISAIHAEISDPAAL